MSEFEKLDITPLVNGLERLAAISNRVEEGDYINDEDGLLYCGKCHTKKQTRIYLLGEERTPFCLCKCKADEAEETRKREELRKKVEKYQKMAFDDFEMLKWTFENDDGENPTLTEALKKYVNNFSRFVKEGKGLLLHGNVGTGKSFAAVSVANALIKQGYPCRATDFSRIVRELNSTFDKKQEYLDEFNRYALLIIDDLGVERDSEYVREIVWSVIDSRSRSGLPFIITTNLSIEAIKNPDSIEKERIYSRILGCCHPIYVGGRDRRKMRVRDEFTEMQDLLGL